MPFWLNVWKPYLEWGWRKKFINCINPKNKKYYEIWTIFTYFLSRNFNTASTLLPEKSKKYFEKLSPQNLLASYQGFAPEKIIFSHPFSNIKTHHHLFLCFDDLRGKLAVFLHTKLLVRHKIKSKRNKEVRTPNDRLLN